MGILFAMNNTNLPSIINNNNNNNSVKTTDTIIPMLPSQTQWIRPLSLCPLPSTQPLIGSISITNNINTLQQELQLTQSVNSVLCNLINSTKKKSKIMCIANTKQ